MAPASRARVTTVLVALLVAPLVALPAGATMHAFPDSASPVQDVIQGLYTPIFWTAAAVAVLVELAILFTVVKWGPWGKGRQTHEHERGNNKVEIAWTIAPAIILVWIGIMSFNALMDIEGADAFPAGAETIEIVGHQWFWEARYENGLSVIALDRADPATYFHVPAGEVVILDVKSEDVIHAINIPDLGVKLDAYADRVNRFWFEAREEREYFSQCVEYCGTAHAFMHATFVAEDRASYEGWLASALREQQEAGRLTQDIAVRITLEGLAPTTINAIVGARIRLTVDNSLSEATTFAVGAPIHKTVRIPAGESEKLEFTIAEPLSAEVTAGDFVGSLVAAPGRAVDISLFEESTPPYEIRPATAEVEAGEIVVFNVKNDGTLPHNFFVGHYRSAKDRDIVGQSVMLGPGDTASVAVSFAESGSFDTWCDVPGHHTLGMHGTVSVG